MLVLLAFPVLAAALLVLEIDRKLGAQVFSASSGGAILWQHLFWFFGHPEVYIVALPFFGIATEVLPVFSRKPLFGYKGLVGATIAIAGPVDDRVGAPHVHHRRGAAAVLLVHDLPDRGADRGEVLQLGGHDLARPAHVRAGHAVHPRVPGRVPVRRPHRRSSWPRRRWTSRSATPTSWSRTSTTCCSAPWCSACSAGSTSGGRSGPARCWTTRSASGTSGRVFIGFNMTFLVQHWLGVDGHAAPGRQLPVPAAPGHDAERRSPSIGVVHPGRVARSSSSTTSTRPGGTASRSPSTTRGASATRWSGPRPARRRGTTSPRSRGSGPSGPRSTCTTRTSGRAGTAEARARRDRRLRRPRFRVTGGGGMKVEGYLFLGCAVFFGAADIVYWHFSHDPTGTTALALAVGLAFLTGFYVLFTGRRLPPRPEDNPEGEIDRGHRGTRLLQPAQLVAAVRRPGRRDGRARRGHRLVAVPDRHAVRPARHHRLRVRVLPRPLRPLTAAELRQRAGQDGDGRLRSALHHPGDAPGQPRPGPAPGPGADPGRGDPARRAAATRRTGGSSWWTTRRSRRSSGRCTGTASASCGPPPTGTGSSGPGTRPRSRRARRTLRMVASAQHLADHFEDVPLFLMRVHPRRRLRRLDLPRGVERPAGRPRRGRGQRADLGARASSTARRRWRSSACPPATAGPWRAACPSATRPGAGASPRGAPCLEIAYRNAWGADLGLDIPGPLWPPQDD